MPRKSDKGDCAVISNPNLRPNMSKTATATQAPSPDVAPATPESKAPALTVVPSIQIPDIGEAFAASFVRAYSVKAELLSRHPSLGGHVTGWRSKSRELRAKVRGEIAANVTDREIEQFSDACADLDALDAAAKVCGLPQSFRRDALASYEAARAFAKVATPDKATV